MLAFLQTSTDEDLILIGDLRILLCGPFFFIGLTITPIFLRFEVLLNLSSGSGSPPLKIVAFYLEPMLIEAFDVIII